VLVSPGGNVSASACKALNGATCGTQDISAIVTLKCGGDITVHRPAFLNPVVVEHPLPAKQLTGCR
jgi:hypothetical protein